MFWMAPANSANVRPGDRDYPQRNPSPEQRLLVHGTIDASLDINFRIDWVADNPKCHYATSRLAGVYAWYTA